ncbi:MAG: DMT family transporter [Pseudomonadota bacterium]
MQTTQSSRPVAANLACFSAMAFWAVGFPAGEILLQTWGTVTLIVVRLILGITCLMAFWAIAEGFTPIRNAPWKKSIAVGAAGFGLGTVLLLYGQKLSDPVTPAIAAAMMPIAGAILEVLLDGRRLRINLILGIGLAIAGGLLATGAQLSQGSFGIGAGLCLFSVAIFAWGTRATTTELHTLSPIGQSTTTMIGALSFNIVVYFVFIAAGFKEVEFGSLGGNNVYHLLNFAIVSLAIAQFLWIWGAGKLGILLASFHMNITPFYVMVFVLIFFGGEWNWSQAAGAGLVASGVIIAQAFPRRSVTNPVHANSINTAAPFCSALYQTSFAPKLIPEEMPADRTASANDSQPCPPFMWMSS